MKRNISQFIILIGISFLISCGSLQERNAARFKSNSDASELANSDHIKKVLYSQFNDWQGVRYQQGGLSRYGIDCSGFVYITFKSRLGLHLPRTTWMQASLGREVSKNNLKAGDLVFFKTGKTSNHVGIYLERNKFLHASQTKGVTISRLDDAYWKSNYWKSIRI
jgi:lipoprotein Spr/probable lipoprotein NlpC